MGRTRRVHPIRTEAIFMTDTPIYFPFACGCAREVSGFQRVGPLPLRPTPEPAMFKPTRGRCHSHSPTHLHRRRLRRVG